MRWRFLQDSSVRLPVVASCPAALEPLPQTDEVRSIALDLDWDSESPTAAFTFRFDLPQVGSFPCSEAGAGDEYASAYDTTFEATARYTYTPPPAA